jgi:hypothetical protein
VLTICCQFGLLFFVCGCSSDYGLETDLEGAQGFTERPSYLLQHWYVWFSWLSMWSFGLLFRAWSSLCLHTKSYSRLTRPSRACTDTSAYFLFLFLKKKKKNWAVLGTLKWLKKMSFLSHFRALKTTPISWSRFGPKWLEPVWTVFTKAAQTETLIPYRLNHFEND